MSDLIETLASYVPTLITRRLADDPTPISQPVSERFLAAVLFADISGFTALTEQLAQRGPVGAEELTNLLNAYFDQLIDLPKLQCPYLTSLDTCRGLSSALALDAVVALERHRLLEWERG